MRGTGYVMLLAALLLTGCSDRTEQKVVALTFDDGPNPPYTEQLLQTLEDKGVKATFFLVAQQAERFPDVAKRIAAQGHEVGGHSCDWDTLAFKRWKNVEEKLDKMDAVFTDSGLTNIALFRPPNGMLSFGQKKKIQARGLKVILGDVMVGDWKDVDTATIRDRVLKKVRPGSIIVLHDGGGDRSATIVAVPLIIDALKEHGYEFSTVSELLADKVE